MEPVMQDEDYPSLITVGSVRVDALQREVTVDGKLRRVTPVECKILHFLVVHANTVCTQTFGDKEHIVCLVNNS